ncbi:MAG: FGGY-family carbohydrate kinase [Candidatus Lokiarchaeota archaeon]|nr:FGGY-family carbohydrate kinase [Candidatus Lokiarchaeota archaeon]
MSKDYVISVDIGTSEMKSSLISTSGLINDVRRTYPVEFPKPGWAEQDPNLISDALYSSVKELVQKNSDEIQYVRGITFTSQMMGLLPLDKTGKPLSKMLTWLDTRSAELIKLVFSKGLIKIEGYKARTILKFLNITGGAPGFSGKDNISKMAWLKEYQPEIYAKTHKFVDTKDYAVYLATGKYITSVDFAYINWMMDSRKKPFKWSEDICLLFDIDSSKLCDIKLSTANLGSINKDFAQKTGLPEHIPVINGSGDLLTAAIGSGAIGKAKLHANIGTAGWVGCHYPKAKKDLSHYVGAIASGIPDTYLIVSKQETLGGGLEWVKNVMFPEEFHQKYSSKEIYQQIDEMVEKSPAGANHIIFTPWLFGERSPINNPYLRGQFFNFSMDHNRKDLFRAVFEGVAYNLKWGLDIVEKLSKKKENEIRVIGGASNSEVWCQIFADVFQKKVLQMKDPQMASAIGAACIAFVGLGIFTDFKQINQLIEVKQTFIPDSSKMITYNTLFMQYKELYKRNKKIFERLNRNFM